MEVLVWRLLGCVPCLAETSTSIVARDVHRKMVSPSPGRGNNMTDNTTKPRDYCGNLICRHPSTTWADEYQHASERILKSVEES